MFSSKRVKIWHSEVQSRERLSLTFGFPPEFPFWELPAPLEEEPLEPIAKSVAAVEIEEIAPFTEAVICT